MPCPSRAATGTTALAVLAAWCGRAAIHVRSLSSVLIKGRVPRDDGAPCTRCPRWVSGSEVVSHAA